MQKTTTRGVYTDWQRPKAPQDMIGKKEEIYNVKWIQDAKLSQLPEHSGESERFVNDILDLVKSHDMTGTTISKWLKPALCPTPASDQRLEYFAAESQGLPKYDNLLGVQL
eukprot:1242981-Karenia_brevis.AAC.1